MKRSIFVLFFAIAAWGVRAQDTPDKNLVKSLDPQGATSVVFGFPLQNVETKVWNGATLRIELEIHANMDENTLNKLIKAGRYTMEGHKEGDKFVISAPNIEKRVTVGGVDLQDQLVIRAQTPNVYIVQAGDKGHYSLERDLQDFVARGMDKTQMQQLKKITQTVEIHYKLVHTNGQGEFKLAPAKNKEKQTDATNTAKEKQATTTTKGDKQEKHGDILIDGVPIDYE